jgi:hypothetical protein
MKRSNYLTELRIDASKRNRDLPQADSRFVKVYNLDILAHRFVKNRSIQVYHFILKIGVKNQMSIPYFGFTRADKS